MVYIWAWQAAPLQPDAWISSMMAAGGIHGEPAAAVLVRDQRGEEARLGERRDELGRITALAVELAPIFAGKLGAERAHRLRGLAQGRSAG